MKCTVVGLRNSVGLARSVSKLLHARFLELKTTSFPDGELHIQYPKPTLTGHVILVQSFHPNPTTALVETLFAGKTAQELGAKKITLVAPYLAYLRQDKRFRPGDCVSNHLLAELLNFFDHVLTIDPHLHRIVSLSEIFKTNAQHITANTLLAEFIEKKYPDSFLIGPDSESSQWAARIAQHIHHPFVILKKKRYTASSVRTKVQTPTSVHGKTVILVDDIISTGHTMLEPIKQLKNLGARRIVCICVHGVFAENALKLLQKAGATVIATNTISNPVARINVAPLIAQALQ